MSLKLVLALTVLLLGVMLFTIYKMVESGRKKAKGAKKRRKVLLPFIYKKKDKFKLAA